jgi:hypothetical protein
MGQEFLPWDGMDSNMRKWIYASFYRPKSSFERIVWEDMRRRYRRRDC